VRWIGHRIAAALAVAGQANDNADRHRGSEAA